VAIDAHLPFAGLRPAELQSIAKSDAKLAAQVVSWRAGGVNARVFRAQGVFF
jgi:hypothetical protein